MSDLVAHRFLVRAGVGKLEVKDEEEEEREADELLFERLQGQAGWQRSCLRLSETLRRAFREADSKLRVLDGNLKWCYECQNAVIPDIIKDIWLCGPVSKFAEILSDYKEGLQGFEKLSSRHFLRPLEIEIVAMLSELKEAPARCLSELAEKLPEVVLLCAEELSQWIGNKTRQLSRHPGCVAEFVSDLQNLEETRGALGTQAELLGRMQRLYEILEEHRVYLSTTLRAKVASMPRSFANFEAVFAKKEEKVVEEREGFLERFAAELSALEAKVQDFASEEQVRHPGLLQLPSTASLTSPALAAGCVPDFAGKGSAVEVSSKLRELEALQEALRKLQEDQELYQSYQEVLKGDGLVVPDLRDAWLQLQRRLDLWRTFEDWQRKCQEWLPSDLLLVDLMLMSKDVTSLWVQADAAQHDLPENAVFEELQSQLKYMQDLIPVLEVLQNPHLRGRHWKELSATLDVTLDVSHAGRPQLALGQAANWNLTKEMASLLTIARRATQEHYVELALENLTRSWSRLELPIVEGPWRVESLAALFEQLQDGLAVVGSSSSRFAAVHADRVKLWQARFEKVEELLSELGSCQERFGHLEGIFATDLQKQLPNEFLTFQPVESTWKALLLRLSHRPQVVDLALDPQNLQTLRQLGETMDSIIRDLDGFLVTKRQSFPRLFFFSDAVLLQFLRLFGKRSSPRAMELLARQCFPGLGSWELEDSAVTTLLSVAGERLPLLAKVKLRGPEQTLEAIQTSMTAAFRQLLKGAIEEAAVGNAVEWAVASALPSQVVEVAWQVTWTMQLESLLLQSREAAKDFSAAAARGPAGQCWAAACGLVPARGLQTEAKPARAPSSQFKLCKSSSSRAQRDLATDSVSALLENIRAAEESVLRRLSCCLVDVTDGFLAQNEPLDLPSVRSLCPMAGIRKAFGTYNRAIITFSESSNSSECPFSTKRPAVHFRVAFAPRGLPQDEAMELVAGMRKWMFDEEEEHKHVHNVFARTLCDAVKQAVEEVKGEQGLWPQAFMVAKLEFCHSDRLRASHLAMIKCRYFESLRDPTAGKKGKRLDLSVDGAGSRSPLWSSTHTALPGYVVLQNVADQLQIRLQSVGR
ncbi:Dynein heavy chain 6, axonemal [Symbiodinium microadriaticum]|uniref:Dynein heavy chain 6, axonemal n=2 Tax=Symbiodinium TaxID=2949 RepID=A0A1Q9CYJ0_SYMMI|nr:Dynein heavy chain 6, axonemal [Symbiodinium microadriaticum]